MKNAKIIRFKVMKDDRGSLIPIEACVDLPFEIKRVYYITDVPTGVVRGGHAHKNLMQVLVCVKGSVKINIDNGEEKETFILSNNSTALFMDSLVWCEMLEFTDDAVVLALVSEHYDKLDYINNYDEFLSLVKGV